MYSGVVARKLSEKFGEHPAILDWDAPTDGQRITDAEMTNGSALLQSASGVFLPAHVGKPIRVDGAGAGGSILKATIVSYGSATEVVLSVDASTDVTGATAYWGTYASVAINAAIQASRHRAELKGTLEIPSGLYILDAPLVMVDGLTLKGPECHTRYGVNAAWKFLTACFVAGPDFPANSPLIDARGVRNTGYYFLEIVGDGTSAYNKTDATSRGILLGSAEQADGVEYNYHSIHCCSIINHAYGIWAKLASGVNMNYNNIGNNWKIGVYGEKYAFNDKTYVGNMINSGYWENAPGSPLSDTNGIGLKLGYGCAHQTWVGGKFEFNSIGVHLAESCFGIRFKGCVFDANSRWNFRLTGNADKEDINTDSHAIEGCMFMGGSYAAGVESAGLDAHVFVEGQRSTFEPVPLGLTLADNVFRATKDGKEAYWGVTGASNTAPNKYPKNAVVRCVVQGSGTGKPTLRIAMVGNDCFGGSVRSGIVNVSGTSVSRVSGDAFSTSWTGYPFFYYWFNEYTIAAVADTSNLTLTASAGTDSNRPYHVNTSALVIDSNFSSFSEIIASENIGIPNFHKRSSGEQRDWAILHDPDDLTLDKTLARFRVENSGKTTIKQTMKTRGYEIERDMDGLLYLGRTTLGYGGAVIDAASSDGVNNPSFLSVRVGNNEYLRVVGPGIKTPYIGVNADPGGDYRLNVSGNAQVAGGSLRLLDFPTKSRFVFCDSDGWLIPSKVKVYDATQIDVAALTNNQFTRVADSNRLVTDKVTLSNAVQVDAPGGVGDILVKEAGGAVSAMTPAAIAAAVRAFLVSDPTFIAFLSDHTHSYLDSQADGSTGTASGHEHPIGSAEVTKTSGTATF